MSEQRITETPGAAVAPDRNGPAGPAPAAPRPPARTKPGAARARRQGPLLVLLLVVAGGVSFLAWLYFRPAKLPPGFAGSNGRIEATEIDIATKSSERLVEELVDEGDFVKAGQVLARMNTEVLTAQLREAEANLRAATETVETARYVVKQKVSEKEAALATVAQRQAELSRDKGNFDRGQRLRASGSTAISEEELDFRRAAFYATTASLATSRANVAAADAGISTAKSLLITAESNVKASEAKVERLQADIKDSTLRAPRDGRVQYRVAQVGEVLNAGGKVLNMVDLTDVYMTFFLPTAQAGKVKLGAEARIVLDALPDLVIPARVTFVADVAQFTPKTVETAEERQKLTFRIKAHIPADLLRQYIRDVKTGLPGVAYVQLDPQAPWPAHLEVKLPQ